MPLVLSGDGAVGPLSATEVSYLDGVTSSVQTQIDGKAATPGAWSSWTPTLSGITIGNGTVVAKYTQIGKVVHCRIIVTIGSTSSVTGDTNLTVPVTGAVNWTPGSGIYTDSSTGDFGPILCFGGTSLIYARAINASGTYGSGSTFSSTIPITWATNDTINLSITYEAA